MRPCTQVIRPRIGIDFHVFDGIFQGSRSHLLGLYAEVVRLAPHYDFIFFLAHPEELRSAFPPFSAANVRLVEMPRWPGVLRVCLQLPWFRATHKIDLLHTQYRIPPLALGPCACTIHDILFESHPEFFGRFFRIQSRLVFRYSARHAALLFSVSEFSKSEISGRYGVAPEKIVVLHNGVDERRFFPGDTGREVLVRHGLTSGQYILTVGRLEPRKNHANLLRAFAQLRFQNLPLVIVGQRDFGYHGLSVLARELGIDQRVRFLESVSDTDLPAIMRHAGVFVFPAFAEGFGMPVIEAMASGLPVVTSGTTALSEVAGDAAVLIDPSCPNAIADAITRILDDGQWRDTLRGRAVAQAKRFDWQSSAKRLVTAYDHYFATRAALPAPGRRAKA